jgi:hypothetical protein
VSKSGGKHQTVWTHPVKPGKFAVSESWTALRAWDPILKGMVRTCGIDKGDYYGCSTGSTGSAHRKRRYAVACVAQSRYSR